MTDFLYIQFGDRRYLKQIRLSVTTLLGSLDSRTEHLIHIYSEIEDDSCSDYWGNEPMVVFHHISREEIEKWTDGRKNYFKAKIKVLQEFFREYSKDVVLVDSDVLFGRNIEQAIAQIDKNTFLMDFECRSLIPALKAINEYCPTKRQDEKTMRMHKCYQLLETGVNIGEFCWKAEESNSLYNSGIIGISYENREITEQVLILQEYLFSRSGYGAAEEVSFSMVFQRYGEVRCMDKYRVHYYECKDTYYIAGYILGMLDWEDEHYLKEMLSEYGVKEIEKYHLILEESNNFMDYLRFVKGNNSAYFGNEEQASFYTSAATLEKWRNDNLRCFRKWIRKEKG